MNSDQVMDSYNEWCKAGGMSPGTLRLKRHYLHRLAKDVDLLSATPEDLASFLARDPKWKPATRRAVQDLLGHSSLATTQRYLAVTDEQKLNAVRSLGGAA